MITKGFNKIMFYKSLIIFTLALIINTTVNAQTTDNQLKIQGQFIVKVPAIMTNSAAFMTIENPTNKKYILIKATSDIAKLVELHTHIHDIAKIQ
jgi:copper(I)-binding protein